MTFSGAKHSDIQALSNAAKNRGVPLQVQTIADTAIATLYEVPLVLVRPDGHVAWRGSAVTDASLIIDTVRGAEARQGVREHATH